MLNAWTVLLVALAYVGFLFAIASYGDRRARLIARGLPRTLIYALSLGVYCTSWTFFGSVGLASRSGLDFLPIYIGPILMFAIGWPIITKIVSISKRQNITSIADFISARYGKNQMLGGLVAAIAVIGIVPYISLQLKAVAFSLETIFPVAGEIPVPGASAMFPVDIAFVVAVTMAGFAALFGTRHIDATEHQDGMILAIAVESVVKLVAFLVVGIFVTFWMMGGVGNLLERVAERPDIIALFSKEFDGPRWITMVLLAMFAIMVLPRQFHVTVVENSNIGDVRRAAWMFPLYLVVINIFVVPIAIAGVLTFGTGSLDADRFVLALPVESGQLAIVLIAFVGGLSAATAMVIIEAVALSIMVCNNLVLPLLLSRGQSLRMLEGDIGPVLILIRRVAIVVILILAYSYYRMIGNSAALAQTGLLSFAAVAQFAPAVFGGLFWRGGTARAAIAGLVAGFALWAYTLMLPVFADAGWVASSIISEGPFGIALLKPRMLFNLQFDPLTHGVLWSLGVNMIVYISVSVFSRLTPGEQLQASSFVSTQLPGAGAAPEVWQSNVTVGQLQTTLARYLGTERADRSLREFARNNRLPIDYRAEAGIELVRHTEHLLASAVGAASSRLVMALLLERGSMSSQGAMRLLDDASAAIQYNRDLLQSALDHVRQGIAVFDQNKALVCWNRQFRELLDLPAEAGRVGVPLDVLLREVVSNAGVPEAEAADAINQRLERLTASYEVYQERMEKSGIVLEVRSSVMPDGGTVVTFADITDKVIAAEDLQRANETLERRVSERTAELTSMNQELDVARLAAEQANIGKTRFVAAASHDILQPLNAARLFTSSLVERHADTPDEKLVRNVDSSLEAVEEILNALLDISRLDAGALKPEVSSFRLDEMLQALETEFMPMADARGLKLKVLAPAATVTTDRRLLRRVLQNLIANAIKYTVSGRILVGCRRKGGTLSIQVHDTGPGIDEEKQERVFREFERLEQKNRREQGLGLGLSIVERIAKVLDHDLELRSTPGSGSMFAISVPVSRYKKRQRVETQHVMRGPGPVAGLFVLIIDNEQSILDGMRSLLGGWGCRVACAKSRTEGAEQIARSGQPDLIIADYHLDDSYGLDVISDLRTQVGRHVPAILVTADRTREVQERTAALDVTYLRKPVKPAALRASMLHAVTRVQAAE